MSFFRGFRETGVALAAPESMTTLDHMERYFADEANWTQGMYQSSGGARCLAAAAEHVRVSCLDEAKHFLRLAIKEVMPDARIEDFNDRSTFTEVKAVIARARQLAAQSVARALPAPVVKALPPPAPVVEYLPAPRPTLPAAAPVTEFLPTPRQAPTYDPPEYFHPPRRAARGRRRRVRSLATWIME